ncbi:MAG: LCP family protein [Acutalibacteraceae bacterium]
MAKHAAGRNGRTSSNGYVDINKTSKNMGNLAKKKPISLSIRILTLVLSVIFLIGGCGLVYYYSILNSMNFETLTNPKDSTEATEISTEEDGSITLSMDGSTLLNDPKVLNVMLFGEDTRATATSVGRSDTMVMLSVDNRHKKIKLTSFLRDTYVYIPDYGWNKLNAAYSYGGAALSIKTIETNYGVKIDRYAVVDFKSFKKIINALGGIKIKITGSEARYINAQIIVNNQDCKLIDQKYCVSEYNEKGKEIKRAVRLNGKQALWYSRDRGGTYNGETFYGDDWTRTQRQRNMLNALMNSVKKASMTQLVKIVNAVGPMVTTNFKKTEMTTLVASAPTYLTYDMKEMHMPPDNTWSYGRTSAGASIIQIDDWKEARLKLAKFIYEHSITSNSTGE